ncbi:MAG: two-component system response regulator [Actinomycetota bacterium]|nr:MAG: two-component system response regulator [Actinomycetota bacterium]
MPDRLRILLVEDNPADAHLVAQALGGDGRCAELHVARTGEEALAYLRPGPDGAAPRCDLILLDLRIPGTDGREVLAEVRRDPALRRTPVVVLSTSSAERDVLDAYDLHANAFVTKPLDLEAFLGAVGSVVRFFSAVATLPSR